MASLEGRDMQAKRLPAPAPASTSYCLGSCQEDRKRWEWCKVEIIKNHPEAKQGSTCLESQQPEPVRSPCVQDQPDPHREFQVIHGYIVRSCLKRKRRITQELGMIVYA